MLITPENIEEWGEDLERKAYKAYEEWLFTQSRYLSFEEWLYAVRGQREGQDLAQGLYA